MEVLIVRHAIAEDHAPAGGGDAERALTARGAERMELAARGLARLLERPDAIYTSPLVRAAETARILSAAWGGRPAPAVAAELAPGPGPAAVERWLRRLTLTRVALCGHEPGCSELLSLLLAGGREARAEFKKGGAALLEVETRDGRLRGELKWLATPKILRLAAGD